MSKSPTLITGAAGFAGSHLIDVLPATTPIVAWHRPGLPARDVRPNVSWQAVELTDRHAVARAVAEASPSHVYHLAGAPSVETSWRSAVPHLQINALGTHHLLEAVRTLGAVCRVLIVSSGQIYQGGSEPIGEDASIVPSSPYGATKVAQDQLALRAHLDDGLDTVVARPFNHTGPRQEANYAVPSFARQIARIEAGLDRPVLRVGNLDTKRDLTDVRDVVAAYIALMARGRSGHAYNVCSGRAWRIGDLLDTLRGLAQVAVVLEPDPDRLRPNDIPLLQGDATRLRTEIGWSPVIPIEQTLGDTLDWWREIVAAERNQREPSNA